MNATNLTKQIFLFSFGPNVSQDQGYNTETNTTSGLLASAFFVSGTADYKYYQKKKIIFPLCDLYNHTTELQASGSFLTAVWNFLELIVTCFK